MGNRMGVPTFETSQEMNSQGDRFAGHHFEYIDRDAVPDFSRVSLAKAFPMILKDAPQAYFPADKFHAYSFELKTSQ